MRIPISNCLKAGIACLALTSASLAQDAAKPAAEGPATESKAKPKTADQKTDDDQKKADGKKLAESPSPVTAEVVFKNLTFDEFVGSVLDVDNSLGSQVAPADDALRAQLGLPKDQGLVVTSVQEGGPADKAGLQRHDVLLTMSGKPVGNADALRQQLKNTGEKPVPIALLRGGKKLTIEVTPRAGVTWASTLFLADSNGFWIGVSVAPADETLRMQLRLPEKRGLVVTKVETDAPAAKAGILVHDVLLEFGGKPLATIEDLNSQIQEVGEKPATMKVLRSGQQQSLQVTPARRTGEFTLTRRQNTVGNVMLWDRSIGSPEVVFGQPLGFIDVTNRVLTAPAPGRDARTELGDLVKEVRKLNERIEALERSLKAADEKAEKKR